MRRSLTAFLSAALCAALLLGPIPAPSPAAAAEITPQAVRDFTISGTGYGHGIGMSQYGAQGYALKGYGYGSILGHYYKGTVTKTLNELFGSKDANPWVNVNIDKGKKYRSSWTLKGYKSEMLVSGGNKVVTVPNNAYRTLRASNGQVTMDGVTGGFGSSVSISAATGDPKLVVVKDASGPFDYTYVRYRGYIKLYASGNTLKAVNTVRMEQYLYGVVPRESPSSWRAEALKAQAVAARSYAWGTNPDTDRNEHLDGELACTTASQVYGAHSRLKDGTDAGIYMHEAASTNSAVDATAGRVVYYASSKTVVTTYFFSQSGGRTANIEDVWVGAVPKPYYKSVDDPYESLAGANKCPWPAANEKHLTGIELAQKLRAETSGVPASPAYVTGVSTERAASGYPRYVNFRFSNGTTFRTSGWNVRNALDLLSPMFYFSGFPMSRISGANRYATAAAVSRAAFSTTSTVAVVASGEDFADALTGSGVAGATNGSLLLSYKSVLAGETGRELQRLKPTKIYLMGGTGALSAKVESSIRSAVPGAAIERIAGADRFATAAKAAAVIDGVGNPSKVLLVSGTSWPDAAAASALAYANKYPILLTRQASLDPVAAAALRSMKPSVTLVAGGTAVVSDAAESAARTATGGTTKRLAGADRYSTSSAIARYLNSTGSPEGNWYRDQIYLATGGAFPDALTGGVLAGKTRHPMLLTMPNGVANATKFYLRDNRAYIGKLWVFGGVAAITNTGFAALDAAMMN